MYQENILKITSEFDKKFYSLTKQFDKIETNLNPKQLQKAIKEVTSLFEKFEDFKYNIDRKIGTRVEDKVQKLEIKLHEPNGIYTKIEDLNQCLRRLSLKQHTQIEPKDIIKMQNDIKEFNDRFII